MDINKLAQQLAEFREALTLSVPDHAVSELRWSRRDPSHAFRRRSQLTAFTSSATKSRKLRGWNLTERAAWAALFFVPGLKTCVRRFLERKRRSRLPLSNYMQRLVIIVWRNNV